MQKIRIIVEAEIDEKTMQDCGCNTTDILNGLLICDSYEADGFIITTSIRGCDNTSDFFLKNGIIKKAKLLNGNVSKENAEKDKENENDQACMRQANIHLLYPCVSYPYRLRPNEE